MHGSQQSSCCAWSLLHTRRPLTVWTPALKQPFPCGEWFAAFPIPLCSGRRCHAGSLGQARRTQPLLRAQSTTWLTIPSLINTIGKASNNPLPPPLPLHHLIEGGVMSTRRSEEQHCCGCLSMTAIMDAGGALWPLRLHAGLLASGLSVTNNCLVA